MKGRRASWLAWGLFAAFLMLWTGLAYLEVRGARTSPEDSLAEGVSLFIAFAAFAVSGAMIASRQPRNPIGWLLLAAALGATSTGFAGAYANLSLSRADPLPGTVWVAWYQSWSWLPSMAVVFFFLPLLFPTGRLPSRRWRPVAVASAVVSAAFVAVGAFSPTIDVGSDAPGGAPQVANPLGIEAVERLEGGIAEVAFELGSLAVILLVLASVVFRYLGSPREQREQLKWFLFAVIVNVVGLTVSEFLPAPFNSNVVFALFISLVPLSIAIAVLKYRLYDIDVVIHKTLVYGALAGLITAVYVGLVVGVGSAIGTGAQANLGLQVAATALVAVAFQPARARVQRLANRLVYGRRAEPYEVMAQFGARMAGSIEVEEVLPRTAEVAAHGVGAARARVRVFLKDGSRQEAHWPADAAGEDRFDVRLPITHQGEPVGEIAVAKAAGDPLRSAEQTLLRDLASHAGLALHNLRLTTELRAHLDEISRQAAELRESQARIVTAADDERRRLERTIEDRVERRLDQIAAALRDVVAPARTDPEALAARLEGLREETQASLEDLREIARGIYPPLLADRGLAEALAAQARKDPGAVRLSLGALRRYEEELEAGVYFCCLEAIGNAPRGVSLTVRDGSGALQLAVEGDLPSDAVTRVRDRVEALGGTLEHRGTALVGEIPARALESVR